MNRFATATATLIQASSTSRMHQGQRQNHLAFDSHARTAVAYNRQSACTQRFAGASV